MEIMMLQILNSAAAPTEQASDSKPIMTYEGEGSRIGNTQFCMNFMVVFCWKFFIALL